MSNNIFLIRHGQTDMNIDRCLQGRCNTELNAKGLDQARRAADEVKKMGLKPDMVYSSPLNRAFKTACIVSGFEEKDIIVDDRLQEMCFGIYEGMKRSDVEKIDPGFDSVFFGAPDTFVPMDNGESFEEVIKRGGEFLTRLKEDLNGIDNKTVFIFAHGAIIRGVISALTDREVKDFWKIHVHNLAMKKIDLENKTYEDYFDGFDYEKKHSAW